MTPWDRALSRFHHYFALFVILCVVEACGCKPANTALAARETVRGAILGLANGAQYATLVCARVYQQMPDGPEAEALFETCSTGWDQAKASLNAADHLVDVWDEATAPRVVCLASRALAAVAATMTALRKLAVTLPPDVKVTIDDGIRLGEWLLRLAPGSAACEVPAKAPSAPAAAASGVTL